MLRLTITIKIRRPAPRNINRLIDLCLLPNSLSPMLRNTVIRSVQLSRNMSSVTQPTPIVACGRSTATGKLVSQHLLPEYEGSWYTFPDKQKHNVNAPQSSTSSSQLRPQRLSSRIYLQVAILSLGTLMNSEPTITAGLLARWSSVAAMSLSRSKSWRRSSRVLLKNLLLGWGGTQRMCLPGALGLTMLRRSRRIWSRCLRNGGMREPKMRRLWCTSCFVEGRLSSALPSASSTWHKHWSRTEIKEYVTCLGLC